MPVLKRVRMWIFTLISLLAALIFLVLVFNLLILALPFVLILVMLGYFFKMFNKLKKDELKYYQDIEISVVKSGDKWLVSKAVWQ